MNVTAIAIRACFERARQSAEAFDRETSNRAEERVADLPKLTPLRRSQAASSLSPWRTERFTAAMPKVRKNDYGDFQALMTANGGDKGPRDVASQPSCQFAAPRKLCP